MFHFSLPLPLRFPHPLDRVSATKIDRFATLGWWANRSLFLLKLHRGHTLNCQSVARQVGFLEDAAGFFTLNQYRQDRGPGDQRGLRPLRRGARLLRILEPGGSWRIFRSIYAATFLYARKQAGCRAWQSHALAEHLHRVSRSRQLLQKMRRMQEGGPLAGSPF